MKKKIFNSLFTVAVCLVTVVSLTQHAEVLHAGGPSGEIQLQLPAVADSACIEAFVADSNGYAVDGFTLSADSKNVTIVGNKLYVFEPGVYTITATVASLSSSAKIQVGNVTDAPQVTVSDYYGEILVVDQAGTYELVNGPTFSTDNLQCAYLVINDKKALLLSRKGDYFVPAGVPVTGDTISLESGVQSGN